mgnify:FL=1
MAYDLKEEFREIYECTNRRAAVLKYTKWSRKVKQNVPAKQPTTLPNEHQID